MFNKKKGALTLDAGPNLVLMLGLMVLITAAVGLSVQAFQTSQTLNSASYNITGFGLTGLLNFSIQMPTIGTILGVALIIGIVVAAFAFGGEGGL